MLPTEPVRGESSKRGLTTAGQFVANLGLLAVLGVGSLYWIGYHTELLGIATGLLSLGGVFAWLAFLSGFIRDERKKDLQTWLDDRLSSGGVTGVLVVLVFLLITIGGLFGSVRIDGRRDVTDRFVEIRATSSAASPAVAAGDVFAARSVRTFPVFVGWRRRAYELRLDGLPKLRVDAAPYHRTMVISPNTFVGRNIVLMRPTSEVSQTARGAESPYQLTVKVGADREFVLPNYRGETVWIGCDDSVVIPEALRQRWRLDFLAKNIAEARMLPWLSPLAVADDRVLRSGEKIRFQIGYPGQPVWIEHEASVLECGRTDCFPQEVVIDAYN